MGEIGVPVWQMLLLLVVVGLEDAQREPKIAEEVSPIYQVERLTASGQQELIGYMLLKYAGG